MSPAGKDVVEALVGYEAQADLSATVNEVHILHCAAMFDMNGLIKYCLNKDRQIDMITTKGPDYNRKARFNWFPREMTPLACAEGHLDVVTTFKAPNGLAQTTNQRFKPWFKPMILNRFSIFLIRFKTGSGFQINRLTIGLNDYFIDIFNMWIAASNAALRSGKTSAAGRLQSNGSISIHEILNGGQI